MSEMSYDFTELDKLAADLGVAADNIGPFVVAAVTVGARNLRDDARENAKGMPHAPAFPYSITYDVTGKVSALGSQVVAEIGPDKGRAQGALGNLIEYGSINNPPQGIMHGALQREQGDFELGLAKAEEDALKKAGL